jgi:hypothetical protein
VVERLLVRIHLLDVVYLYSIPLYAHLSKAGGTFPAQRVLPFVICFREYQLDKSTESSHFQTCSAAARGPGKYNNAQMQIFGINVGLDTADISP